MSFFYADGCSARGAQPAADIALVEGVMGMYDGLGPDGLYSTAWLAGTLGIPVILLVDAKSAATSVAATVKGFASLEPLAPRVSGVIANRVSGEGHAELISEALERFVGIPLIGWLPNVKGAFFPSRHLGLIPASEIKDTEETLGRFVNEIKSHVDVARLVRLAESPSGDFTEPELPEVVKKTDGSPVKVAIANDDAFCFHYHENWELLERLGAEVVWTSPIADRSIPEDADALILPGGYPEEFALELSGNVEYLSSVRQFSVRGPVYAECGGMMYLTRSVEHSGGRHAMAGVIEADARMTGGLRHFGYVEGVALRDNILFKEGETVRAHEFHYSGIEGLSPEAFEVKKASRRGSAWIDGYTIKGSMLATYLHLNFYTCPQSAGRFLSLAASVS
jgi:cobyrinic acid a,c-diamide synthase